MTDLPPLPPAMPSAPGFDAGAPAPPPPTAPAAVAAGNGIAWWSEGWRLFALSPWVWIAITVMFLVIMVMLALHPDARHVATTLLSPVLAGGVLAGCRAQDRGGELTINHLFASFSDRLRPLLVVGLLYLAGLVRRSWSSCSASLVATVGDERHRRRS